MNGKKGLLVLVLVLILVLGGAAVLYNRLSSQVDAENMADAGDAQQLTMAPDFTVYDGDGNPVKLSDFRGKPVVLNFWASWCGPCKSEMPDFQEKYQEMGGDIVFMMVNATDGSRETVDIAKAFVEQSGYSFPVYYDTQYQANYAYGVTGLPTTFFINAEGYLVAYGSGAMSADVLQTGIDMIKRP